MPPRSNVLQHSLAAKRHHKNSLAKQIIDTTTSMMLCIEREKINKKVIQI